MSERSLGTLKTSGLLFLGGFLLMSLLAGVGSLGGKRKREEPGPATHVEAPDTTSETPGAVG